MMATVIQGLRAIGAAAAIAMLMGVSASSTQLRQDLHATAAVYYDKVADFAPLVGRDTAMDYLQRLNDDYDALGDAASWHGYTQEQRQAYLVNEATLDLSLIHQIMTRQFQPLGSIRGLGETLLRSSVDGTMQPVAAYVPSTYRVGRPAPLVMFLHGRPQSESNLLAPPFIAALAERTGSIIIAPYVRGEYDIPKMASDVYDALAAATGAFTIDSRKRYLAGYSAGGFSVFQVGPVHPGDWTAVMSISGGLIDRQSQRVLSTMRMTPFYLITGSHDNVVPTQYPTSTAVFLQSEGVPVSFYSQTGGTHGLITLLPVLSQAWDDMHDGITRAPPPTLGFVPLLTSAPRGELEKP
jgi:acetyl esterase/lipase